MMDDSKSIVIINIISESGNCFCGIYSNNRTTIIE